MWNKCEDRLPKTPKDWRSYVYENKEYLVAYPNVIGGYSHQIIGWCNGWNCCMKRDGTVDREHEMKDIVAWMEIPEYKG